MTKDEIKKRLESLPGVLKVEVEDVVKVKVVLENKKFRDEVYREEIDIYNESGNQSLDFSSECLDEE